MSQFSLNNRLIVEAYKTDKSLRANVSNGFATIAQKTGLKGLKVLIGTTLSDGRHIPAGATAYIREEILHTAPWAQKALESETINIPFIIVDLSAVEYVNNPADPAA